MARKNQNRNLRISEENGDGPNPNVANGSGNQNQHANINPFIKLLQVDVVANELVRYLSFEDLKALTQVSKDITRLIRKTTIFSDWTTFQIPKDDEESRKVIIGNTFPWKHLSIEISKVSMESVDLINDILETSKSVSISSGGSTMTTEAACYLRQILQKTNNIQELELGFDILTADLLDLFPTIENVITNLEGLTLWSSNWTKHKLWQKFFDQNLQQISSFPLHLKKFVFGWQLGDCKPLIHVTSIIKASQATLEHLELHGIIWKQDEMKSICCPNLKHLILQTCPQTKEEHKKIGDVIEAFVLKQPLLEELAIAFLDFPYSLFLSLQSRLTNMKRFILKIQRFVDTTEPIDWTFLKTLNKLSNVFIRKPDHISNARLLNVYGCGENIIKQLPTSSKSITVQGMRPFWKNNNDELKSDEHNIGTLLSRFENLTVLNLVNSSGAINDAGLQTLIRTCPKLIKLAFSHCPDVTAFGMSGIRDYEEEGGQRENSGLSLTNIKGLTSLRILGCSRVTPDCILDIAKFQHLRRLDYCIKIQTKLDKEFVLQIIRQNQCLEKLGPFIMDLIQTSEDVEDEIKMLNPRIKILSMPSTDPDPQNESVQE